MADFVVWLCLLCALFVGYVISDVQGQNRLRNFFQQMYRRWGSSGKASANYRYYAVLTTLLNEEPDEAVDALVSSMKVSDETLEMHLALGALLQRRGEFSRAMKVHQYLLSHPSLTRDNLHCVRLAFAEDFYRSGILDRAESVYKEIEGGAGVPNSLRRKASMALVVIYQDLGEWLLAIDTADKLTGKKFSPQPDHWRELQGQYCCELAEMYFQSNHLDAVEQKVREALAYDPRCVRATLLSAKLHLMRNQREFALNALQQVPIQDSRFVSEVVPILSQCVTDSSVLLNTLNDIQRQCPSMSLALECIDLNRTVYGESATIGIAIDDLCRFDFLALELQLFELAFNSHVLSGEQANAFLDSLKTFISRYLRYVCSNCGFESDNIAWQCPSCRKWGKICIPLA